MYLQYRLELGTANATVAPTVRAVNIRLDRPDPPMRSARADASSLYRGADRRQQLVDPEKKAGIVLAALATPR